MNTSQPKVGRTPRVGRPSHLRSLGTPGLLASLVLGVTTSLVAQQITPVWVQHHNGLVNVDPLDKLSILIKKGSNQSAYAGSGRGTMEGFCGFFRYDDDHYLLAINENGVDEATETDPDRLEAARQCPDRSMVWVDAHTGKYIGIALATEINPVPLATQPSNPFWWKIAIDDDDYGKKAAYAGFKYKIIRYAPGPLVPDPAFPLGRPTWVATPTEAYVEPVPGEPNPTRPPLDQFVTAINYSWPNSGIDPNQPGKPAPVSDDDPAWNDFYLNSSNGDGSASFRIKALRVQGKGAGTVITSGGATWRASNQEQELRTKDGLTFYPVARLNDRGDCWGAKGCYSLGGQPSSIATAPDGRRWMIQGHFPGTGWGARPGRYTLDPEAPNNTGRDATVEPPIDANDAGPNHKSRPNFYDPDNRALGGLPEFCWESAGTCNNCGPNRLVDGVQKYDGNWILTAEVTDGADFIVSYAMPSWNQQFGAAGNPNSVFTPGWLGLHTLDGKISPGSANAWKLPCTEIDEPVDGNGGTGFDYGYDGYVKTHTNPDGSTTVLAAFGQYGFGVFRVDAVAPSGAVTTPQSVTTVVGQSITLGGSFAGLGSPLYYKWEKAGLADENYVAVPNGSGNPSKYGEPQPFALNIASATPADSGKYRYKIWNSKGQVVSGVATVIVSADEEPPVILSTSSIDGSTVDILFNEPLDPNTVSNTDNFDVDGVPPTSATLMPDGRTVHLAGLSVDNPFNLNVRLVADRNGNAIFDTGVTAVGIIQGFTVVDINAVDGGPVISAVPGTFEVPAGGGDIWGSSDQFRFVYQERAGDFDVRVQVKSVTRPSNRNGIMARTSLDGNSPFVFNTWNPDVRYGAHVRTGAGSTPTWFNSENNWVCDQDLPPNIWLRLKRSGDDFTAFRSENGTDWLNFGSTTVALGSAVYLGMAANSGSSTLTGRAVFANYSDYSHLRIVPNGAGTVEISWEGSGTLETSTSVTGPWSPTDTNDNPQTAPTTDKARFYRLR